MKYLYDIGIYSIVRDEFSLVKYVVADTDIYDALCEASREVHKKNQGLTVTIYIVPPASPEYLKVMNRVRAMEFQEVVQATVSNTLAQINKDIDSGEYDRE